MAMKKTAVLEPSRADDLLRSNARILHGDHSLSSRRFDSSVSPGVRHHHAEPADRKLTGPVVIGVRGPSRSGKTALCERLITALSSYGLRTGWVKRTHHLVDSPGKASDRVWKTGPAATALRASDRLQVTLPPGSTCPDDIIKSMPADLDVVLVETHERVDYPTILSDLLDAAAEEKVIGRWSLFSEDASVVATLPHVLSQLPADHALDRALRAAIQLHGGHGCAGLILGTRLAMTGAAALGIDVPDREKRLIVVSETERCAVDGIQAVTGCRPGKRTLRLLDYGKLAATFLDERSGRAVRVATRGDLRERVGATGTDRYAIQRAAYASWPAADLFTVKEVSFALSPYDRPGPPVERVICVTCAEEVADGRHIEAGSGPQCRPCWAAAFMESKGTGS